MEFVYKHRFIWTKWDIKYVGSFALYGVLPFYQNEVGFKYIEGTPKSMHWFWFYLNVVGFKMAWHERKAGECEGFTKT